MLDSRVIHHQGKRYTLCEGTSRVGDPDARGVLSRFEAERLLQEMMHGSASADLRSLYVAYSGSSLILQIPNGTILRWLVRQLQDPLGGGRLVLVEEDGPAREGHGCAAG